MKLSFEALTLPTAARPDSQRWGQLGTVGTPVSMRVSADPCAGGVRGTSGDTAERCPQLSQHGPRPIAPDKFHEINMSPVSPIVPAMGGTETNETTDHEAFEERAAIMEFDGGMTRASAEVAARTLLASREHTSGQGVEGECA